MIARLIALLSLFLLLGGPVSAQPSDLTRSAAPAAVIGPRSSERIEAELVPMSGWATPGSTAVVAIRQRIQPGWHTYWRNPGDSGGATTLDWLLPTGVSAGEIVWPLPERQRLQGLMNYGYSGIVYLPVPIGIPADARPGTTLPLRVKALFLVCSDEMCVPDELELGLDLPVREGAAGPDPRHGEVIAKVLAEAPRPAGIEARATLANGILALSATGGRLGPGVGSAWFFPFDGGLIDHAAAQPGEAGPNGLTLRLTPGQGLPPGGPTAPLAGVLATDKGAWEISAVPGSPLAGASGGRGLADPDPASGGEGLSPPAILQALTFALLGGLILNLMPCVFPILSMKAASLAASAAEPAHARRDGLAFLAGVLLTFLILAGVLIGLRAAGQAVGWGFQLQTPAVTAVLALVMLAAALNLSNVFHMGAGLQGVGSGPMARLSGAAGAFFTGMLAVVVAAPCTAPFMAAALGAALVMPWPLALLVFLMLGLGLALPYLAVSLSPGLLRRLPSPGPWMERLKTLLAFPLYGTTLWLVWVFGRQTGWEAMAGLMAGALMLALSLWLWGQTQGARSEGRRGVGWTVGAALTLLLAIAAIAATVAAVRLSPPEGDSNAGASAQTALSSQPWSPEAVQAALGEGRPVLVNFTADWCVTCKINERTSLSSARVAQGLGEANAVYLVGDWTRRDDAITAELERRGRSGVPLYLLYRPGEPEPRVLPQLLTEGLVLEALEQAATG